MKIAYPLHANSRKNLELGRIYRFKKGDKHTDEWKRKHRDRMTGKGNPFYGKKHSKVTREKMRKKQTGRVGPKSARWRGGITKLRRIIKQNFKYRQWRSDVYTRDGWRCVDCRDKGAIEAHHTPIRFAVILEEYHIKTIEEALACEKLWDINNGITLCQKCHTKRHANLRNFKNRIEYKPRSTRFSDCDL